MLRLCVVRSAQPFGRCQRVISWCHRVGMEHLSINPCFGSSYSVRYVHIEANTIKKKNVFKINGMSSPWQDVMVKPQRWLVQSAQQRFCSSVVQNSDQGKLIYTGSLGRAVLGVKFFSYSSSMFSICVTPYLLLKTGIGVQSLALQVAFFSVVGFFTFMTPLLLHLVTKGYVLRLYHNQEADMYTAVTYSALLVEKATVFHQRDVTIPDVSKMFTTFYAKKKSMLVNPMLFPLPQDYNHLMGYDQPFSFNMEELKKPESS